MDAVPGRCYPGGLPDRCGVPNRPGATALPTVHCQRYRGDFPTRGHPDGVGHPGGDALLPDEFPVQGCCWAAKGKPGERPPGHPSG